jgi:hypothetical protein
VSAARGKPAPQSDLFAPVRGLDEIATDPMVDEALRAGAWVEFSLSGGKDCGAVSALTMLYLDSIGQGDCSTVRSTTASPHDRHHPSAV